MSKITLNDVSNLIDTTTAKTTINTNSAIIEAAIDNTLSRDGTSPNQMNATLDMNSNRIINLPDGISDSEPVTVQTFNSLVAGAGNLPSGGTTGQILAKTSNTSFATTWENVSTAVTAGTNIAVTGTSPITVSTSSSPTFNTSVTSPNFVATGSTSGSTIVKATATASGTITIPAATDTLVGKATTDVLTNKTFDTSGTGNSLQIGSLSCVRGQYPGTNTNDNATAGYIGEFISSQVVVGSAVALTSNTPANVTSISLTAGDWDVYGNVGIVPAGTTTMTTMGGWISTTSATSPTAPNLGAETFFQISTGAGLSQVFPVGKIRLSLSGTTTVFLTALSTFAVSTNAAYGFIGARRVR